VFACAPVVNLDNHNHAKPTMEIVIIRSSTIAIMSVIPFDLMVHRFDLLIL
jgi:hypothetical protein